MQSPRLIATLLPLLTTIAFAQAPERSSSPVGKPFQPTPCAAETKALANSGDDIVLPANANLTVMFHGNRFVAAKELVTAFEKGHPGVVVAYTSIPPIHTFVQVLGKNALPADVLLQAGVQGVLPEKMMPDVVMLPDQKGFKPMSDRLTNIGTYSAISGVVLISRKDDDRVKGSAIDILKNETLRVALPGLQGQQEQLFFGIFNLIGRDDYDHLVKSNRVGFSGHKHHRAIPARIAAKCEDVGVQYQQSQRYLEKTMPGVFKFESIPTTQNPHNPDQPTSYVYVVNGSPRAELAKQFADFMLAAEAQEILRSYSMAAIPSDPVAKPVLSADMSRVKGAPQGK